MCYNLFYSKHIIGLVQWSIYLINWLVVTESMYIPGKNFFSYIICEWLASASIGCTITNRGPIIKNMARHYLRYFDKSSLSRSRSSVQIPVNIRKREGEHWPQILEKQLRCAQCHYRTRWALCIKRRCVITYHTSVLVVTIYAHFSPNTYIS